MTPTPTACMPTVQRLPIGEVDGKGPYVKSRMVLTTHIYFSERSSASERCTLPQVRTRSLPPPTPRRLLALRLRIPPAPYASAPAAPVRVASSRASVALVGTHADDGVDQPLEAIEELRVELEAACPRVLTPGLVFAVSSRDGSGMSWTTGPYVVFAFA